MVIMKSSIHLRYQHVSSSDRERGVALIMALICLFVISTLAVGIMYSTQSEIWTTANYRATTQARYIAEAGAQQALNYLQSGQFVPPSDLATAYNLSSMPVLYSATSKPVILATNGMPTVNVNGVATPVYADTYANMESATDTAFQNYFSNSASTLTSSPFSSISPNCSGTTCPRFDVALQLLTAVQGTGGLWLTRWKIISDGTLNTVGGSTARVQIVEVVDNVNVVSSGSSSSSSPTYSAGVFATGKGCGAISMSGGQYTNSYNSTAQPGVTSPTYANTGGGCRNLWQRLGDQRRIRNWQRLHAVLQLGSNRHLRHCGRTNLAGSELTHIECVEREVQHRDRWNRVGRI